MYYMFLANGFEITEAMAPLDIMRRAGLEVKTVGVTGDEVQSSNGVTVKAFGGVKPKENAARMLNESG